LIEVQLTSDPRIVQSSTAIDLVRVRRVANRPPTPMIAITPKAMPMAMMVPERSPAGMAEGSIATEGFRSRRSMRERTGEGKEEEERE
jgi:hypothetical protein